MKKTRDRQMIRQRLEVSYSTLDIASEVEHHTRVRLSCPDSKKQYNGACPYPNCSADTNGFIVWPELTEKGCHYYCRQCGKKGDILKLIMDIKSLKFGEACKELGIPNPYREDGEELPRMAVKRGPKVEDWQRDELSSLTSMYGRAQRALQRERARAYLAERAIPFELAEQRGLGYFPALSEVSRRTPELERFRRWCDRIIFPIHTPKGEVGYCGRSLFLWESGMDEDEQKRRIDAYNLQMREQHGEKAIWYQMPRWKYTYQQGFFNLQTLQETKCPVLVEGPFDVLACLASGIEGAISIGTTGIDAGVLPATIYNAIIGLDMDGPGRKAAMQLAKGLRRQGIDVHICSPVDGKDWSAAYRMDGENGLASLIKTIEIVGRAEEPLTEPIPVVPEPIIEVAAPYKNLVEREEPSASPDALDQFPEKCEDCHAAMGVDDRSFFYWQDLDMIHCFCDRCRNEQTGHPLEKPQATYEQFQSYVQAIASAIPDGCSVTLDPPGYTIKDRTMEIEAKYCQRRRDAEAHISAKPARASAKLQERWSEANSLQIQRVKEYRDKWRIPSLRVAQEVAKRLGQGEALRRQGDVPSNLGVSQISNERIREY